MLVECGFVRATTSEGAEFTFTPSLGRIAALGSPQEIVRLYARLHGSSAAQDAAYILASLCDKADPTPLIGWSDETGHHSGLMPPVEQILLAQHLMQHGIAGKARPGGNGKAGGKFSNKFEAAEYIAAARVHLGLSSGDAEALSMTEFQMMFEMKFPKKTLGERDVPTRDEYNASLAAIERRKT